MGPSKRKQQSKAAEKWMLNTFLTTDEAKAGGVVRRAKRSKLKPSRGKR